MPSPSSLPLLPSGNMNFALLRRHGYYYVDKTAWLRELIEPVQDPLLLTRPRRFGKTLLQTTLKSFLELNYEHPGSPNADVELFEGLAVSADTDLCTQYQSRFPVIFLTLKDVQFDNFTAAYNKLCARVEELCSAFSFMADDPHLSPRLRRHLALCMQLTEVDDADGRRFQLLTSSLLLLSQCLYAVYKRPAYILIDEYDVPLLKAAACCTPGDQGYYIRLRDLICALLGEVVKTADPAVRRCILTSCLRLTLPGRFSGLNNLRVMGMDSCSCDAIMGFTQEEVERLLCDYGLQEHQDAVASWYDGYLCGRARLYNPWSVLNYCADLLADPQRWPQNYWVEASSDDFRPFFLNELSAASIERLQHLLDGGSIPLGVRRAIGYPDLEAEGRDDQVFFTLLYYTGYLTRATPAVPVDGRYQLAAYPNPTEEQCFVIPNCEVLDSFRLKIHDYFRQGEVCANPLFRAFIEALMLGEQVTVEDGLCWLYTHYLDMQAAASRLSRHGRVDAAVSIQAETAMQELEVTARCRGRELGYQALCMGVLASFDQIAISALRMERVLGTGRVDLYFEGKGPGAGTACLLEFKVARGDSESSLERAAELGLSQTRSNGCAAKLLERNPALQLVYSYGIGCRAKQCRVRVEAVRRDEIGSASSH